MLCIFFISVDCGIPLYYLRYQSSWGQHGAHLGPVGPRWAPCWSHEPCYQRPYWAYHSLTLLSNSLNDSCDSRGIRGGCGAGVSIALQWRHNKRDGVSNHRRLDCLLNRLFRRRSTKINFRVTGIFRGIHRWPVNSPHKKSVTWKSISIWWRCQCGTTNMNNNSDSSS